MSIEEEVVLGRLVLPQCGDNPGLVLLDAVDGLSCLVLRLWPVAQELARFQMLST